MEYKFVRKTSLLLMASLLALHLTVACTHNQEPLAPTNDSGNIFIPYDTPPAIVGGFAAFQNDLVYPEDARNAGIEGRVQVQALIDSTGEVVDIKILKRLGYGCDQEAMRVLLEQTWLPALQRDRPVKVWVAIPVTFELSS